MAKQARNMQIIKNVHNSNMSKKEKDWKQEWKMKQQSNEEKRKGWKTKEINKEKRQGNNKVKKERNIITLRTAEEE